jgi:hypothetical protein
MTLYINNEKQEGHLKIFQPKKKKYKRVLNLMALILLHSIQHNYSPYCNTTAMLQSTPEPTSGCSIKAL